jgi:hypothetical protein
MQLITGTLQQMTDLEHQIFVFGAPFRATFFGNSTWDEQSLSMIGSKPDGAKTTKLQEPVDMGGGTWGIVHIDEMPFAPTTFAEYIADFPELEEDQTEEQKVIISRIPEGYEDYTPQQYVSEVIIGELYTTITL